MAVTFALLTLAVLALWVGQGAVSAVVRHLWLGVLVVAALSAGMQHIVRPVGFVWLGLMGVASWGFARVAFGRAGYAGRPGSGNSAAPYAATGAPQSAFESLTDLRDDEASANFVRRPGGEVALLIVAALGILVLSAGLMTHQLPGFSNPRVLTNLRFSPDSIPYSLYLNFDKTAAGILLLGWCHARLRTARDWGVMLRAMLPWALGILLVMAVMAALTGYIRFDPKAPPPALLWMWANLCFTCVAEEALFRGFIQAQLQRLFRPLAGGQWIALAIAAAAFGLAHSNGGAMYVLLSTLAGLGYGWVYQRTRRIEASILLHFSLNTAHFLLMSYPALQR